MTDATVEIGHDEPPLPALASHEGPLLGTRLGRYIVIATLGTGSMGIVVRAYDPELDRKVALKLIRPRRGDRPSAHARLFREAQALAKLNHPHVITVYEVGSHDDQLFVAMELVEGQTLRAWLDERPRAWREVVRVFEQAGRGLAAAHAVGLVHRDFKPDNVMLDAQGRVRVMDFGLARAREDASDSLLAELDATASASSDVSFDALPSGSGERLHERLTMTGALLGTPAYMAPEQWLHGPATVLSDQYAFCVALFEALFGHRPFAGKTFAKLRKSVLRHELVIPRRREVPPHLRRVVLRGLALAPEQRHASMDALLDELVADPSARRQRVFAGVGVLALLAATAWLSNATRPDTAPACADMHDKLGGSWDDARKHEIEAAILATDHARAGEVWTHVERDLDAYADAWVAARVDACEASLRGEQSGALLDRRMACLDERLDHLRATTDELVQIDAASLFKAGQAIAELPGFERCADPDALLAELPPPEDPELAHAVARLDARLVDLHAMRTFGRYAEARADLDVLLSEAQALGHDPLLVRIRLELAETQLALGDYAAAAATFEQVYFEAFAGRMLDAAADAAASLVLLNAHNLADAATAERWVPHAEASARASGSEARLADFLGALGRLRQHQRNFPAARELVEQQLDIVERLHGPDTLQAAVVYHNLAGIAYDERQLEQTRSFYARSIALYTAAFGEVHPQLVALHSNLGLVALDEGRRDEAYAAFEHALAIGEQTVGPDHAEVVTPLFNLGIIDLHRGRHGLARERFGRALDIFTRSLGPEHPNVASCYQNLAKVALAELDVEGAIPLAERALDIKQRKLGPDSPSLLTTLTLLAELAVRRGELARAHELAARALDIGERAFGRESAALAIPLDKLGTVALRAQQPATALAYFERSLDVRTKELGADHPDVADSRWNLAEALVELGRSDEALALIEQARAQIGAVLPAIKLAELDLTRARALAATQPEQARTLALAVREQFGAAGKAADPEQVALVEALLAALDE